MTRRVRRGHALSARVLPCMAPLVVLGSFGWSVSVQAYSDPERFARAVTVGGSAGRTFTGSRFEGRDCSVCHVAVDDSRDEVIVDGWPTTFEPAEHEVSLRWSDDAPRALAVELRTHEGTPVPVRLVEPRSDERCDDADPRVLVASDGGRVVALVPDCGATALRVRFTTEGSPVVLEGAMVRSDRSGTAEGDRTTPIVIGEVSGEAGCGVAGRATTFGAFVFLIVLARGSRSGPRRRGHSAPLTTAGSRVVVVLTTLSLASGCATSRLSHLEHATYVRADDDDTVVVTPSLRGGVTLGDRVELGASYGVDVWTGASIDVRTAATRRIREARHEARGSVDVEAGDVRLGTTYRASREPDHRSDSGEARLEVRSADTGRELAVAGTFGLDRVGRVGDPFFDEQAWRFGGRVRGGTPLGPDAWLELALDASFVRGFQSSPYRWVGVGGRGFCADGATYCVLETHPGRRDRYGATLRARTALSRRVSLGGSVRGYADSWDVRAVQADVDLAFASEDGLLLRWGYRPYLQTAAEFHRARNVDFDSEHLTRDRKLSPLNTHTIHGMVQQRLHADSVDVDLGVRIALSRIRYLDFVGLSSVHVVESTFFLGVAPR